jgi:hypothetical protein
MGTTAARLHLALPVGVEPDIAGAVGKAYAKLGWAKPKRGEAAGRRVVLARSGDFVTLHDGACEALDDGTLQQLGALLTKALGTGALLATLQDSDRFELQVFARGRQVDAVTDGEPDPALKTVRGKRQATAWCDAFRAATLRRVMAGERDPAAAVLAGAKQAEALESAFAEDRLLAWCALAGLAPAHALATAEEAADRILATLDLAPRAVAAPASAPPAGRALRFLLSTDDTPYHGFHPAPWPVAAGGQEAFAWTVTVAGGGLRGVRLDIAIARGGAFRLRAVSLRAFSFHSGQITSMTPLARWEHDCTEAEATAPALTLDAPDFAVRDPAPGSRAQALLWLRLVLDRPESWEATIAPRLLVDGEAAPLDLPPLRLAVQAPSWMPLIADPAAPEMDAVLRLNAPSLHTAVAILPDGDAARAAIRAMMEAVLARCAPGLGAEIVTEKHMTPSFTVPKGRDAMPLGDLFASKRWPTLFDAGANFAMVRIGLVPPGAPWPVAGLLLQASLRGGPGEAAFGIVRDEWLHVALWCAAAPEAEAALGHGWAALLEPFLDWVRQASPQQGWVADCAWHPLFDRYEDFEHTPYEKAGTTQRSRMSLHDAATGTAWRRERLLFVAPRLWLGAGLAAAVDRAVLGAVATVTAVAGAVEVALRPGAGLADLEQALRPILPLSR